MMDDNFRVKSLHLAGVRAKNFLPADELTKMTIKVLKRDSKVNSGILFTLVSNEQFIQEDSSLVLSFFFHKICTKNVFHGGGL